jgi:hypothetical protein
MRAAALLVLVWLGGCAEPPVRRLQPDDVITPEIGLPDPWHADRPTLFTVRLRAHRPQEMDSILLQAADLPSDLTGTARVVFFHDEQPLDEVLELPLMADC